MVSLFEKYLVFQMFCLRFYLAYKCITHNSRGELALQALVKTLVIKPMEHACCASLGSETLPLSVKMLCNIQTD